MRLTKRFRLAALLLALLLPLPGCQRAAQTLAPTTKRVALTFDDGPGGSYTRQLIDILDAHDAHATFFVLGSRVSEDPDLLRELVAHGHQVGSHTWNHVTLAGLSQERIAQEIATSAQAIEGASGVRPTLLRPPYGQINQRVLQAANDQQMAIVLWNIDTLDWKSQNADAVCQRVFSQVHDGDIILMHDIFGSTVQAAERVVKGLSEQGYSFVTVQELLEHPQIGSIYRSRDITITAGSLP
ncbi:MAG: polysaccharide deacetylase family protein [Christensenellales bacterium]|jgi:peptidoglycan/xylan/chitin deacetylase (PgdA/CDA1 family)